METIKKLKQLFVRYFKPSLPRSVRVKRALQREFLLQGASHRLAMRYTVAVAEILKRHGVKLD